MVAFFFVCDFFFGGKFIKFSYLLRVINFAIKMCVWKPTICLPLFTVPYLDSTDLNNQASIWPEWDITVRTVRHWLSSEHSDNWLNQCIVSSLYCHTIQPTRIMHSVEVSCIFMKNKTCWCSSQMQVKYQSNETHQLQQIHLFFTASLNTFKCESTQCKVSTLRVYGTYISMTSIMEYFSQQYTSLVVSYERFGSLLQEAQGNTTILYHGADNLTIILPDFRNVYLQVFCIL